jgi:formylglycine-generating enzyme required for sulfatase activity
MRWLGNLALGLVFWCATHADAWAEKRVALVIGNGMYTNAPNLPNPPHDAEDVAAAFKRMKFDVIQAIDLDHSGMQDAVIRFARAAQSADVGIFYYSGHAIQFNGVNYLMPVDAKLDGEADLYRFTKVDDVLGYLQKAKALKVLVLDSCRDNPLAETLRRSIGSTRAASIQRGLARIEAPIGTIISYSTQAGRTAVDGTGRHSPYTTAFLKHIEEPSEIGDIFRVISADVYRVTGETQLPELSLSIIGKFYLKGPVSPTVNVPPPFPPADSCAAADDHWKSAEAIGSLAAFEDHLARFPGCAFAGLAKARIDALKTKVAVVAPPALPTTPPRTEQAAPAAVSKPPTPVSLCSGIPPTSASLSSRPRPRPFASLNIFEECMLKPGDFFKECLDCPEMVVVPAGSFAMGFDPNDPNESHQVTLARPFAVGRFHVTVAQFAYFVSETGYQAGSCFQSDRDSWRNPGFSQSDNNPVVCVSWDDATAYLAWLSKQTRDQPYRLLTEAEWEYAARAGSTTRYFWGDDNSGGGQAHAHCQGCNTGAPHPRGTVQVGSFKPNMFGLYDMAGNAQQLVQDCDHPDYRGAPTDGAAWTSGPCKRRAIRGGSWLSQSYDVGSYDRHFHPPDLRSIDTGFRVARTLISR